jgi:hypothetical protein
LLVAACSGGGGSTTAPSSTGTTGATISYQVSGVFSATAFPTCAFEIGDLSDSFTFVIVQTPSTAGNTYQVQNITNTATVETNARISPALIGTYSASGAFELQTVTSGQINTSGTTLLVTVSGTTTNKACTFTPTFGPPTSVPGGSLPTAFVFQFNPDVVGRTPVTLPPVSLPNSTGTWSITIVNQ